MMMRMMIMILVIMIMLMMKKKEFLLMVVPFGGCWEPSGLTQFPMLDSLSPPLSSIYSTLRSNANTNTRGLTGAQLSGAQFATF